MEWMQRISCDAGVSGGQPRIAGTRVPVCAVLDALAAGLSHEAISQRFPAVEGDDILAAAAFASAVIREMFDSEAGEPPDGEIVVPS